MSACRASVLAINALLMRGLFSAVVRENLGKLR